jgi:mono/diheme cytochrome c family protein
MVSVHVRSTRFLLTGVAAILLFSSHSRNGWAQDPGEQVFNTTCFACHTIGGGRLIGPDLAGVHEKRSKEWLERFVKSSQSMINAGDPEAVALFEEYSSLLMPDAVASEEQIRQVLSYIKSQSSVDVASTDAGASEPVTTEEPITTDEPASEEDILAGQEMFEGGLRFANGGPACNACHEVRNDAVIGGGILAAELTTVFSRMGGAGVTAILGRAPFPVMQAAYEDRSLTESEVTSLVAFLEYADSEQYNQLPRDYGLGLFASGVVGAGVLFGFFGFVWRGRKIGSVNQAIYDRQIKSSLDDTV